MATIVPPLKCQGIKTKLVRAIRALQPKTARGRWIEPFCGSCVVPFNVRPERALLCDSNEHIIQFYTDVQSGARTRPSASRPVPDKFSGNIGPRWGSINWR